MQIVTGLRFVERNIPIDAEPPMMRKILQQQKTEIWFELLEHPATQVRELVMCDKPLDWMDVPMHIDVAEDA